MKKFKLLYLYVLIQSFSFFTSQAQISPTGLVAQWNYSGNADDSSGNGHHGTAYNVTYDVGRSGKANSAGNFNGSSSYVSVPYASSLNLTNFSICATVKIKGFYTGLCQVSDILQRGTTNASGNYGLRFNDTDGSCSIVDTGADCFIGEMGPNNRSVVAWPYQPTIRTGRWYSVVETWDGTTVKIWVDGVVVKSAVPSTVYPLGTSTDGLYMGAGYAATTSSFPYWYNGLMDEVRVYSRVLADSEINQFYTNIIIAQPYVSTVCPDNLFDLPFSLEDSISFVTGTTFTAQLSNASGSFASPVAIGSSTVGVTHPLTGVIHCRIPKSVSAGTGYKVRIITSNTQFPPTPGKSLTVLPSPPGFSAASNSPICGTDTLHLFGVTTGTGITWAWSGPNGFTSTTQNNTITPATSINSGSYILKATLLSNGCTVADTETVIVTIDTLPGKPVAGNNGPLCNNDTLRLTAMSTTPGVTYSWAGPNGYTSAMQNPLKTAVINADSGVYIVTAYNHDCPSSDTILVSVLPDKAPSATIALVDSSLNWPGALIQLIANATDAGSAPGYQWLRNGVDIPGAVLDTFGSTTFRDKDQICVKITSSYLCANPLTVTVCANITIATSISKLGANTITVYPNPVGNELNIKGLPIGTRVQLSDIYGRLIYDQNAVGNNMVMPTTKLTSGTYMLQLISPTGERSSSKIIKE